MSRQNLIISIYYYQTLGCIKNKIPDTAIILREVSKNGFASGFLCSIGIGLGVTIHSILAVYGISLILFSISTLSIIISMIGGSYLLYLGYLSLRFPDPNLTTNQLDLLINEQYFI